MGGHWLEVLPVPPTCRRSWKCFSCWGDDISLPDKSLFNCRLPYIGAATLDFLCLIPVYLLGCKIHPGQPCFLRPIRNTKGKTFSGSLCAQIKKGQFFSIPREVKWGVRDVFGHNRMGTWDLETHITSVSGHLERFLDYKSWWWTDVSL